MKSITLREFGRNQLQALCQAVKLPQKTAVATEIFDLMSESWSESLVARSWPKLI